VALSLPLRNRLGERLEHVLTPGKPSSRRLVLVAHGLTSSCERPYLLALCAALAARGIASLRFSFSGNGASEGRFEESTPSKEVEDLGAVLDACAGFETAYVGHSLGAAVGVLRAASDARLSALVSLAGMTRVQAFVERHLGHLRPGDPILGRERCPLSRAFLEDAQRIDTVLPQAARVGVPWLLVHGSQDELVPVQDSIDAVAASSGRAELCLLAGADHRFDGRHEELCSAVLPFLTAWNRP
jgi:pimeloyl-ACP methyl ester carboxylesterase